MVDNYYYRIRSGINLNPPNNLSSYNYNLDSYGLKNECEKAIFFFNMTSDICNRLSVLQMTKKYKKAFEFVEKHPNINGHYFHEYKDFDYKDFQWIGYKKTEWYNERHLGKLYNGLYILYIATQEDKGKKKANKFYDNLILNVPKYFKYSGNSTHFQKAYNNKKVKSDIQI